MFPQLTISGQPHERGVQYGAACSARIRISIASYARLFAYLHGADWAEMQKRALAYVPVLEQYTPNLLEEMHGIAEGAQLHFAEILALNVRTELVAGVRRISPAPGYVEMMAANERAGIARHGECTTVAAFPGATKLNNTLLAQTWDWYGEQRAACVILRIEEPDAPTILTITEAGILAKIGLNSDGVGVSLNILFSEGDGVEPNMPVHVLLRRALQQRSFADAVDMLQAMPAAASSCITIVEASGAGASLEVTPQGVGILKPHDGILAHTNHCVTDPASACEIPHLPNSSSMPRFDRAVTLLYQHHSQIDEAVLIDILRDHEDAPMCICRHPEHTPAADYQPESVCGVILDVASGVMHVAAGVPCQVPFTPLTLN